MESTTDTAYLNYENKNITWVAWEWEGRGGGVLLYSLAVISFTNFLTHLSVLSDLADWLGVGEIGLFNFKPSVRPVPLEVHIQVPTLKFILMKWTYVKRIRCLEEYT
ncbi:DExH-box ATP-dependent RNA helicase DExH14 [Vitis vinifera]|uniref:DExH-box ATP-dependent RNA helicase DExH14 n=1 Tax=Vitis vinifera TaxID=29760 RepID=A0A438DBN1_VITVI|nr:DExH-box ATP-dependent RNA helicase DExH14 [Vitis vinifera]